MMTPPRAGTRSGSGRSARRRTAAAGFAVAVSAVAVAASASLLAPSAVHAQDEVDAEALYDRWCAGCHGVEGDGQGPAAEWMLPRPRDFTTALYQVRTTPSGQLPTDEDILRVIDEGMPGTTMPGWERILSRQEREALVEYVKDFSRFFAGGQPEPMELGSAPGASEERIAEGAEIYDRVECYRCHGELGRGDGRSAPTLEDDRDRLIRAADLTQGWRFNGGGTVEDIYRTMRTGMDGTPMPSQSDLIQGGVITEDELWSLAHYVRNLSPEQLPPRTREVVEAELVEEGEELPTSVDDDRWETVEHFYIPLGAQVIVEPRWFEPRVSSIRVQALHDGEELALRLSWNDPSESPDPEWAEWQERMIDLMEPVEGDEVEPGPRPDRIAVQFPPEMPEGNRRPYFLMGDDRNPVYVWDWRSTEDGVREMEARGIGELVAHPDETQNVAGDAVFEDGQWRVLMRRPLPASEGASELGFPIGESLPAGFFAWDGDNGEEGTRAAISSWYFLHLRRPTPARVYVAPVAAMALTAVLGVGLVARTRRREAGGSPDEDARADRNRSGRERNP